ncbi:MAG: FHA domain-containing protein [Caldilineaceae bacterium]|nr:FHA domain-containing protein [Caldilineaceae bacterium]
MARLELIVDVFDQPNQLAAALPALKPNELVEAVLEEFQEIEYLSRDPQYYELQRVSDGSALAADLPLEAQLEKDAHLMLVEKTIAPPAGASAPRDRIYLREQSSGAVYPLQWLPAIIGRRDQKLGQNELVAVDLSAYTTGLRVSRRQVRITYQGDEYKVENLSNNSTTLIRGNNATHLHRGRRHTLLAGDVIRLDRSGLNLRFLLLDARAPETDSVLDDAEEHVAEDGVSPARADAESPEEELAEQAPLKEEAQAEPEAGPEDNIRQ